MTIERLLVPLDGSELSQGVLPSVEELARRLSAEVCFVRVVPLTPDPIEMEMMSLANGNVGLLYEEIDAADQAARAQLARLASDWQARGITATWEVLHGEAGPEIVEFARSRAVDLIAMSTHGRSGLDRLILGSVAERVVLDSGLPVIVIRPVEQASEHAGLDTSGASVPSGS